MGGGSEKGRQKKLQEMMAESDGDDFSEEEMDAKQKVKTKVILQLCILRLGGKLIFQIPNR